MEPRRAMLIEELVLGGRVLAPGTYLWILGYRQHGLVEIEYQSRCERIPARSLVESPVPRPPIDELKKRDPCFGLGREAFERVFEEERYYEFLRCREHGRLFLDDVRGGVAQYSRFILVETEPKDDLRIVWARYHRVPDDLLNFRGIAL